jgi:hypothetical protein
MRYRYHKKINKFLRNLNIKGFSDILRTFFNMLEIILELFILTFEWIL